MIDIVAVRCEIFERTRSHTYSCMMHGRGPFGYCQCDSGNKKQYLQDLIVQRPERIK